MVARLASLCVSLFSIAASLNAREIKITNKEYGDSMSYGLGNTIVVDYTNSSTDSVKYWSTEKDEGGYKLKNTFSRSWATIGDEDDILVALTEADADIFFFQPAEKGSFLIKLPYEDLVWDVLPPPKNATMDCLAGAIRMRPANGESSQRWYIV